MNGLNDKTVVLAGPFGLLMQTLISRLTEYGANVAVVTDDKKGAQRVCQNISDLCEVSEKFGRAVALDIDLNNEKSAENIFSRSAEMLGGIDIYIDTHLFGLNIPFYKNEQACDIETLFQSAHGKIKLLTQAASSFLKTRTRGRILYIMNELDGLAALKTKSNVFTEFAEQVQQLGRELSGQHTTVNALAIGVSEEFLLTRFGKNKTIQQSQREIQNQIPSARLVDYNDIANHCAFIVSPLSTGLSGQVIHLNHAM